MTPQQLENLRALRTSIADPKKHFTMSSWDHCIYGHARQLATRQNLDWSFDYSLDYFPHRSVHFERWAGIPAKIAHHVFAGLLMYDTTNHISTTREDAVAQIDHWIREYGPPPEETPTEIEELELVPA